MSKWCFFTRYNTYHEHISCVIHRQVEGRNYTTCFPKDLEGKKNTTLSICEPKLQRSLQVLFSIMQIVNILFCQLVLVMMFHAVGDEETAETANQSYELSVHNLRNSSEKVFPSHMKQTGAFSTKSKTN